MPREVKSPAREHTASLQQHQHLYPGFCLSPGAMPFSHSHPLCFTYLPSTYSSVASPGPGSFGDSELYNAGSLPLKSPPHITCCTRSVRGAPVPSQESLSPSLHGLWQVFLSPGAGPKPAGSGWLPTLGPLGHYGYALSLDAEV